MLLFDIEWYHDLEIWVRGHSRSFKMVPFESLGAVSYSPSTVTMVLSCISSEIKPNIGRKSWFFHTPLHSAPPLGEFLSEYRHPVWYRKTRMVWLPDGEKISKICLFVLTWSKNVTDRQTDGQTDTACWHILRLCIASRGKNLTIWITYRIKNNKLF